MSSVTVVDCPDLRESPSNLACEGLSGSQSIADIGGQPNLFPQPRLDKQYSLINCARLMGLDPEQGSVIGAGAGPNYVHGTNSELVPDRSWQGGFEDVNNRTRSARLVTTSTDGGTRMCCPYSDSTECSLMMNLYGSIGLPGPVLKVTARGRRGEDSSFTGFMRSALREVHGENRQVSLGGVFLMKRGWARFHVMPSFPTSDGLPFKSQAALDGWLPYHDISGPMVCLSVFHSTDPNQLGIRMKHTHCFNKNEGGHYHYYLSTNDDSEVEYYYYYYYYCSYTHLSAL